jgi:hypothetical protein
MQPIPEQKRWDIDALSEIRCEYFLSPTSRNAYKHILTVRYTGLYRVGCKGGPDATYMQAVAAAALVATSPNGLVVDFTALDYKWGDDLERVYDVATDWPYRGASLPFALVLGEHCRTAVISLACQGQTLQEPEDWMFDTFPEAWQYVDERIRA